MQCMAVLCSALQGKAVPCSALHLLQHSTVQNCALKCSTVHNNVLKCSTVYYRAVHCSAVEFRELEGGYGAHTMGHIPPVYRLDQHYSASNTTLFLTIMIFCPIPVN